MGSEGLREALTAESIVLRMLEHVRWVQNEAGPFYRGGYRERAAIAQIAPIIEEYARRTAAQPAAGEPSGAMRGLLRAAQYAVESGDLSGLASQLRAIESMPLWHAAQPAAGEGLHVLRRYIEDELAIIDESVPFEAGAAAAYNFVLSHMPPRAALQSTSEGEQP